MALLPKKLLTTQNLLIGAGIAVALYFGYQYVNGQKAPEKKQVSGNSFQKDQTIKTDPKLELRVTPSIAVPRVPTSIAITGVFKNDQGNPSPVQQGYYAIYDSLNRMITQGSLGSNVSSFSRQVVLPPLNNGEFMVAVSDEPIMLSPNPFGNTMPYPTQMYGQGMRHHHHHHGRGQMNPYGQMIPQAPQQPQAVPQQQQQQTMMPQPTQIPQQPVTGGSV